MEVHIRLRPPLQSEIDVGLSTTNLRLDVDTGSLMLTSDSNHQATTTGRTSPVGGVAQSPGGGGGGMIDSTKSFHFDHVHKSDVGQEDFYEEVKGTLLERCFRNVDSTVIVMGPEKSGKSFTFHSSPTFNESPSSSNPNYSTPLNISKDTDTLTSSFAGIFPRFVSDVLAKGKNDGLRHPAITIRAYRVYGETITDLLPTSDAKPPTPPTLKYSPSLGTFAHGVSAHVCKGVKGALEIYEHAIAYHAYTTLETQRLNPQAANLIFEVQLMHEVGGDPTSCGKTTFVEVGSFEICPKDFDVGDRLTRTSQLGHELEALRGSFTKLGYGESDIGYRGSALTYLLRAALGGKTEESKVDPKKLQMDHFTLVVGCFSPCSKYYTINGVYLKALDFLQTYNNTLEERVEKFERVESARASKGGSRPGSSNRLTVRSRERGGIAAEESQGLEMMVSAWLPKNIVRDLELEIETIEESERERIRIEEEEAEAERVRIEEEEISLGIRKKKPKFMQQLEEEKKDDKGGGGDEEEFDPYKDFAPAAISQLEALKSLMDHYSTPLKELIQLTKEASESRVSFFRSKRCFSLLREDKVKSPYLVAISDDQLLNGKVRRIIEPGKASLGRTDALTLITMPLGSAGVLSNHAEISNNDGALFLKAEGEVFVNGIGEFDCALHQGDTVNVGCSHVWVVWNKEEIKSKLESGDEVLVKKINQNLAVPKLFDIASEMGGESQDTLMRTSKRHWREMESVKQKLMSESTRCALILENVKIGAVGEDEVDVEGIKQQIEACENALVDIDDWKMKHEKICHYMNSEFLWAMKEANEISEELEKFMVFELTLVAVGGPSREKLSEEDSVVTEGTSGDANAPATMLNLSKLNVPDLEKFPAEFWIKATYSNGEMPQELWHFNKFQNRLSLMRWMFKEYVGCNKDLLKLKKIVPPAKDPFYEPPTDALIGVGYCFLDSISYLVEIHEAITIINFKGALVGELELEVTASLETDDRQIEDEGEIDFTSEEFRISEHVGETMFISVNIKTAKGLPRRTCNQVFVSFPFFLSTVPYTTTRCQTRTVNPWFNETFGVTQVITEDFIDYLAHNALEVEVWGAPDSKVGNEDCTGEAEYGDVIGLDEEIKAEEGVAVLDDELDVAFLNEQLEDSRHELKMQRELSKKEKERRDALVKELEEKRKEMEKSGKEMEKKVMGLEGEKEKMREEINKLKSSKVCVIM